MPQKYCVKCEAPITTWYRRSVGGKHPDTFWVYTCGSCLTLAAVQKFTATGFMDHLITDEDAEIGRWPDIKYCVEALRLNLGLKILKLQREISPELTAILADCNGEYEACEYPLSSNITNHCGRAEVSFGIPTDGGYQRVVFQASECDPSSPWKLTGFAGSDEGLAELLAKITVAIQSGQMVYRWVIHD